MDLEVGGTTYQVQKGGKIELGVASDHLVIYTDPDDFQGSVKRIANQVRLHNFAKAMKAGLQPDMPVAEGEELPALIMPGKVVDKTNEAK
jgi:hypothetical protein